MMKKFYTVPTMELEIFETNDVITASQIGLVVVTPYYNNNGQPDTVDASDDSLYTAM